MSFLAPIFARLREQPNHVFLQEAHPERTETATGAELTATIERVRAFARVRGLKRGDRCALSATTPSRGPRRISD